jgi:hypothetical protein
MHSAPITYSKEGEAGGVKIEEFAILSLSVVDFSILAQGPQIIDTNGPTSHRQRVT